MNTFSSFTNMFLLLCSLALLLSNLTEAEYLSYTFHPSSLLSSASHSICDSSSSKGRGPSSLLVSHRHGPCSPLESEMASIPTQEEILKHDKERVESIRQRVRPKMVEVDRVKQKAMLQKALGLPAKSGLTLGIGNYIVTVGLGTPKKDLSLAFDTGSDLTWTQCTPCGSCYRQAEPIFNPTQSSTYSNITCSSELCSAVAAATSASPACSSSTCIYGIQYGDKSITLGYFAKDTLTLGTGGAFVPNFYFGCGEYNQGLYGVSAGILGLGRNKFSAVSQTASTYGNYFSYCLPSSPSSTGHLTFGQGALLSKAINYTSLLTSSANPTFYFVDFQGISVGGRRLAISPTVFSRGGTIIDSGTVITRLPPDAYTALKGAFSAAMVKYPQSPPKSILDTCYDFSNYTVVSVPKVSLWFGGGASLDLPPTGILYGSDISQLCLAFVGNSDAGDMGTIGNVQQQTFDVVYDVSGAKLGFGAGGCN
ncbi:hypothetical protein RND81_08G087500 [Saponaria officinalis]|uniref:Peptidase A1 domain-containing protein n=1 Tax=Saponaria officinalis TaxID=3572 RepID=A0AAW1J5B9_SAPOF